MFNDPQIAIQYMLAGRATMTLESERTGKHYTFTIEKAEDKDLWWVQMLVNGHDYIYVGTIDGKEPKLRITTKSKVAPDSGPVKAINFFLGHAVKNNKIAPQLRVMHDGKCGRCRRKLTNPESIRTGLGPYCAGKRKFFAEELPL